MLIESVPEATVRWGWKLESVRETTSSGLELSFSNGETMSGFDLIVGADGAWSKTWAFLSPDTPHYSGLSGWTLSISNTKENAPGVYTSINRGSVFEYSDGKSLTAQQMGDGSINVSHYGPFPEDFTSQCGFDTENLEAAKQYILRELDKWASQLKSIVEAANEGAVWRNLYELPVGWMWPHKKSITLLGDAAHVMTPFAGIGVNTAFYDAMKLTKQIVAFVQAGGESRDLDSYIVRYKEALFEHAHRGQALTEGSKRDMLLTPGAPRTTIESWILRYMKEEVPVWAHSFLTWLVYAGLWVYKWFV
ncbi:hypothetical protein E8E12_004102 [Didymella heteroderae]|uniref:FAD-binding domain-containing protein n=1 Tax=Didymella heteroderae TaxID=1769908 RepID=A0A9P5BX34_9PLEO|nr:hypothetical protein E8E12_004102 [Didymella heteroderae]